MICVSCHAVLCVSSPNMKHQAGYALRRILIHLHSFRRAPTSNALCFCISLAGTRESQGPHSLLGRGIPLTRIGAGLCQPLPPRVLSFQNPVPARTPADSRHGLTQFTNTSHICMDRYLLHRLRFHIQSHSLWDSHTAWVVAGS